LLGIVIILVSNHGGPTCRPRMSKRMSYGKIYLLDIRRHRLDIRARPRLPRGSVFTHERIFTVHADRKKRVSEDTPLRPHGRADASARKGPYVCADTSTSAWTRPFLRTDIGATARTSSPPCPRPPSVPPRSPTRTG
jgi:hypothetical protein